MPRKLIRRLTRGAGDLRSDHNLRRLFGVLLHDSNLWNLNRHSVAWGVSVGLFMAFVPLPFQMILAVAVSVLIGCNLPVAIVVVWISNPVTMAPLFFSAYKVGAWLLDVPPRPLRFEMTLAWFLNRLTDVWEPFLLGCLVLGLATAAAGHVAVRLIWRIHVIQSWRMRRRRRALAAEALRSLRANAPASTSDGQENPPRVRDVEEHS